MDAATRELLTQADAALWKASKALLVLKPLLTQPYSDLPETSPWAHTAEPAARRAHDLHQMIRKHLAAEDGETTATCEKRQS